MAGINFNGTTIGDGNVITSIGDSNVISKTETGMSHVTASDPATLEELRKIQENMTTPEIAQAIRELREALERHDEAGVKKFRQELSGGLMVSILSNAATEAGKLALRRIGIPIP